MKVGCLFDINSITWWPGKSNLIVIQSKEVMTTQRGWVGVPVRESIQSALSDWIDPYYDEKLPEGEEKALSHYELDALRLRHRIFIADEVEYILEYVESLLLELNVRNQYDRIAKKCCLENLPILTPKLSCRSSDLNTREGWMVQEWSVPCENSSYSPGQGWPIQNISFLCN